MPGPEPLPWRARGSPGAAYAAVLQLLREEDAGEDRGRGGEGRVGCGGSVRPVPPGPVPAPPAPLTRFGLFQVPPRLRRSVSPARSRSRSRSRSRFRSRRDMHDFFVGLMGKRPAGLDGALPRGPPPPATGTGL
uniref:Neurokinin-B n=1 Tax=Aquila chrysaetos chrysaetos TaxID=223781 RepID=A0A663FF94_AQUCH